MTRQIKAQLRIWLTIALTVGIVLSANSRTVPYDVTELAKIVTNHHAEFEEHGHAREGIVDMVHALHGHSPEIADHDHNIAFLPSRETANAKLLPDKSWTLANHALPDRRSFGLDRPPRV